LPWSIIGKKGRGEIDLFRSIRGKSLSNNRRTLRRPDGQIILDYNRFHSGLDLFFIPGFSLDGQNQFIDGDSGDSLIAKIMSAGLNCPKPAGLA
jgi:hypothetical protein